MIELLKVIKKFATQIKNHIPCNHYKPASTQTKWKNHEKALRELLDNCNSLPNPWEPVIYQYADTIIKACLYLNDKHKNGNYPETERLSFLAAHCQHLSTHFKTFSPGINLNVPQLKVEKRSGQLTPIQILGRGVGGKNQRQKHQRQEIKHSARSLFYNFKNYAKNKFNKKSYQVEAFLSTPEFKSFVQYQRFLKEDQRPHHFFCISLDKHEEKARLMEELIIKIMKQSKMENILEILNEFASGRNIMVSNDNGRNFEKSDYEKLNTGQNITTFALGFLGLKNSTSIQRFNGLLKAAEQISDKPEKSHASRLHKG